MPIWGVRQAKPGPGAQINWDHPLAQGLYQAWPFSANSPAGETDAVSGSGVTIGATALTIGACPDGIAYNNAASNTAYIQASNAKAPPNSFTIAARVITSINTGYQAIYANTGGTIGLYIHNGKPDWVSAGVDHNATNALSLNVWHTIVTTYDHPSTTGTHYTDGVPNGTWSASTPWGSSVVRFFGDSHSESLNGSLAWVHVWNRALPQAQVEALTANPWQLFAPPPFWWLLHGAGAATAFPTAALIGRLSRSAGRPAARILVQPPAGNPTELPRPAVVGLPRRPIPRFPGSSLQSPRGNPPARPVAAVTTIRRAPPRGWGELSARTRVVPSSPLSRVAVLRLVPGPGRPPIIARSRSLVVSSGTPVIPPISMRFAPHRAVILSSDSDPLAVDPDQSVILR